MAIENMVHRLLVNTHMDAFSFPRSSVLQPVTQKLIKVVHRQELNSLIAP